MSRMKLMFVLAVVVAVFAVDSSAEAQLFRRWRARRCCETTCTTQCETTCQATPCAPVSCCEATPACCETAVAVVEMAPIAVAGCNTGCDTGCDTGCNTGCDTGCNTVCGTTCDTGCDTGCGTDNCCQTTRRRIIRRPLRFVSLRRNNCCDTNNCCN